MADTLTKVVNIKVDYTSAIKRLAELELQMKNLKETKRALESVDDANKDSAWAKSYTQTKQAMKGVSEESKRLTDQIQSQIREETKGIGSIMEMTQKLDVLRKQYIGLSEAERNSAKGAGLISSMKNLSERIATASKPLDTLSAKYANLGTSLEGMRNTLAVLTKEYMQMSAAERQADNGKLLASINATSEAIKKQETILNNAKKGYISANGSIYELREKLKDLERQFYSLSKSEREAKIGKDLVKDINKIKDSIKKAEQSVGTFQRNVGNYTSAIKGFFSRYIMQMTLGFTTIGQMFVGLGNAIKSGVQTAIEYNRELSKLQAILLTTADGMSELAAQARKLGAETRYTATEVVTLQTELAKLGYQKGQILNMSESVLYLAQATGSNLADAASLAGAALRIFGDTSDKTAKYVDQISTATTKSALNFDYIKTALPIVGGAAEMFGFKLKDVLTLLGQLANSGMEASMAATATRNIFLKLADSNGILAKQLGKPITNLDDLLEGLEELRRRGVNLNDALELTNVRSAVAFTRFLKSTEYAKKLSNQLNWTAKSTKQLAEEAEAAGMSVEEYTKKMGFCNGTAKEMAEIMENNLGGDLTMLSSKWDEFSIALNNSQGELRSAAQWLAKMVQKVSYLVRSLEDFLDIEANERLPELQEQLLPGYLIMDNAAYRREYKKAYDALIKEGTAPAKAMAEAEIEARAAVLEQLKEERERHQQIYDDKRKAREKDDKKLNQTTTILYRYNLEELRSKLEEETDEYKRKRIQNRIKLLEEEADAKAGLLLQDRRIEQFENQKKEENKSGLGIENDKERKKRLEREKSAAKALLEAKKTYNKAALDQTKENDDAMLIDYEDAITSIEIFMEEATEKQKSILRNRYQAEIDTLQYKIDEELKMRGDESERERIQKEAAIEIYNRAIEEKRKDLNTALQRLDLEQIKKDVNYIAQKYDLRIEAIVKGSKEEIKAREDMLALEMEKELAELELLATKDARIQKELEERKLLIKEKYSKKSLDLRKKALQQELTFIQNEYETAILGANGNAMEQARLEAQKELAKLDSLIKERELMVKDLNAARAASDKAEEAYDIALKTGAEEDIARAKMVADEKAKIYEDLLNEYEYLDAEYQAKIAKQQQTVNETNAAAKATETSEKLRPFEYDVNYHADTDLEKLQAQLALANAVRENMRREDYENDVKFIEAKLAAERGYLDAQKALADKEFELRSATATSISNMFSTISGAISDTMEENKENVRLQKILSLASVYLAQGVAIANAIKNASQSSITVYDMMAQIAVGVATVVSSTVQAVSSIKKAKFAKGAVNIQGAGTTTSDSIDAKISRGESVMTAKATQMFGGLLLVMNKIAAQPNVTLPTMYSSYNPAQTYADTDQQATVFREAVSDIHPVVSVREITDVTNRVKAIETLDTI